MKEILSVNDKDYFKISQTNIDHSPNKGFIYNTMKMRAGFINRLKVAKEELKQIESQMKGRKLRPGVADDQNYTSIFIVMRVLHNYYRENDYLTKHTLTSFTED